MTDSIRPIDTSLFDESVGIGEDFYRHVNGGWLAANPVPPEYGSWGAFHEVNNRNQELLHALLQDAAAKPDSADAAEKMAGDYFSAAMDEARIASAGVEPIGELMSRIAGMASLCDVRDTVRALQHIGVGALHSLGVASDFEDADRYLVYVGQGGLGLPERDYYLRTDDRSQALRDAYVLHVAQQLRNLGEDETHATDAATRILAFETNLAQESYPAEKMRDVTLTLNRFETAKLDELMPEFGLTGYLADHGNSLPSVCVDNPGFFSALEKTLAETPLETLRDYLRFHLVRAYASSLPPAFEEESFAFYGRQLGGQQVMKPRWKRVLDAATSDIGEQVAQLYVRATFSEAAKERCEELVEHLLSAMGRAIGGAAWMTEPTKHEAIAKLAGFGYKIGFPEKWRDYSKLSIERGAFATNRMRAAAFEYDREFGRLTEPVDKTEWEMPAHAVNAYYHPLLNEVVFPAGILQPPFFFADSDDAVNFGAIGAVVGHEITHGFDDQGSRFDASGALRDWWSETDRTEFDRRSQVLVEQFDEYEPVEGAHVNGRLTLGENIADLGGVKVALDALHEAQRDAGGEPASIDGFTADQRFFISYATVWRTNHTEEYLRLLVNVDPHSPARFRVDGPLANLQAFQDAFALPGTAPMLRPAEKRAQIW
jgi:putative endopeptidase